MLRATAKDIGPTLPKYIVIMIIIFPKVLSIGVRFLERPTVAVALTDSYIASIIEALLVAINNIEDIAQIEINITTTEIAFFIEYSEMRRPNRVASFLLLMVENDEHTRTAMVTVFIPPAVPTGEPPINIKITDTEADAFVKFS